MTCVKCVQALCTETIHVQYVCLQVLQLKRTFAAISVRNICKNCLIKDICMMTVYAPG